MSKPVGQNGTVEVGHVDTVKKRGEEDRARTIAEGGPGVEVVPAVENAPQLQIGASALMEAFQNDPELIPLTMEAVKASLRANQMYYDKHTKEWVAEPDARTRLTAAQFVFNNLVGLPLQRIEAKSVSMTSSGPDALRQLLKQSPAMRETVRRMLDAAEKEVAE